MLMLAPFGRSAATKIRSTLLYLSGFELYSRWVPLNFDKRSISQPKIQ